jgi:hypothetical protein
MATLDTESLADTGALLPPGPLQINVYVVVALTAPVPLVPPVASAPLQPPEAVQATALLAFQVNVDDPPGAITDGYTEIVADGTILTVAVAAALVPPAPEHVREYVVAAFNAPVARLPLADSVPVQPPEARQAVAPTDFQVSVEEPPAATAAGEALRLAVGVTGGVVDAEPPPPPPPPQADRIEAAPNIKIELKRMGFQSYLLLIDRILRIDHDIT